MCAHRGKLHKTDPGKKARYRATSRDDVTQRHASDTAAGVVGLSLCMDIEGFGREAASPGTVITHLGQRDTSILTEYTCLQGLSFKAIYMCNCAICVYTHI